MVGVQDLNKLKLNYDEIKIIHKYILNKIQKRMKESIIKFYEKIKIIAD